MTSTSVPPEPCRWRARRWWLLLALLTSITLAVHGFHPLAEDGGLYVAGIKWLLDPSLFPRDTAFVQEHLRFSLFAPLIAGIVRFTHVPLLWTLLALYLLSVAATLYAAREILRRAGFDDRDALIGIALLAACWTMPIAGTSLMLMDPYLTARSLTTPLALLALAWAMDDWSRMRFPAACMSAIFLAAALHPLMAGYGLALIAAVRIERIKRPWFWRAAFLMGSLLLCGVLQGHTPAESAAEVVAVHSRYYWFLSQWQWYERLGLAGPLLILALLLFLQQKQPVTERQLLLRGTITLGLLATLIALLFAQEHFRSHTVARMQPLRVFLELYALMLMIGGATLSAAVRHAADRRPALQAARWIVPTAAAIAFFYVARSTFPLSPQIEWPWTTNNNPWVQAFLWAKKNTPPDALFALDAKYVNTDGEDAQVFRAVAERSMIPDFSKDGGEAAITPALAATWQRAAEAQRNLSQQTDDERGARLTPWGAEWMIVSTTASTTHPCPYSNRVVKVCRLR